MKRSSFLWAYRIAPNFRGIIFREFRDWPLVHESFIHENLICQGVAFSRAERVMHLHWQWNQVLIKILCWLQEIQPFKGSVTSPTGPLSLRMPSFCIGLARRPTNAWQKSWREQATQHPSRPQNQPNEERMRSTHPRKRQRLVVMHGTTATIRPRHASQNFAAITKVLTRKLKISQILSGSLNFCASKIYGNTIKHQREWWEQCPTYIEALPQCIPTLTTHYLMSIDCC